MATGSVTGLPEGYSVEQPQQTNSLPEGYTVEGQPQQDDSLWGKVKNFFTGDGGTPSGEQQVSSGGQTRTVIVPKPGEDFADTMKRAVERGKTPEGQADVAKSETAMKDMGVGAVKSAGQTVKSLANIGTLGMVNNTLNDIGGEGTSDKVDKALEPSNEDQQAGQDVETVLEFMAGDEALKGLSMGEKFAQLGKVGKFIEANPRLARVLGDAIRNGVVGATVGGIHHGEEGAIKGGVGAALVGGGLSALGEIPGAIGDMRSAAAPVEDVAATAEKPGLIKQALEGEKSAQPMAQSAVREGVESASGADASGQPIVSGNKTIVDDHLDSLFQQEKAAYKQLDDTVGFDLKAEKKALGNDQRKLAQLGNTDADIEARGKLIESINDSQDRITAAEQKLKAAGIDPKAGDAIHAQRIAGTQFKQSLVKNTNADGSVNIDGLLKDAQNLRNYKLPRSTKYADRLEQFFGNKGAADAYVNNLVQAQKLGVHAMKMNAIGQWLTKALGTAVVGGTAYEGYRLLTGH